MGSRISVIMQLACESFNYHFNSSFHTIIHPNIFINVHTILKRNPNTLNQTPSTYVTIEHQNYSSKPKKKKETRKLEIYKYYNSGETPN